MNVPRPPSKPLPVAMRQQVYTSKSNVGLHLMLKPLQKTLYWAIRLIDNDHELKEEFNGSIRMTRVKALLVFGETVRAFSDETNVPIRVYGNDFNISKLGFERIAETKTPSLSQIDPLTLLVNEEIYKCYSDVNIFTDASWGKKQKGKIGIGWCALMGESGIFGSKQLNEVESRYAERFAVAEGLMKMYPITHKYTGNEGKITVWTDFTQAADWYSSVLKGYTSLNFDDLPDNEVFKFIGKRIIDAKNGKGPVLEFKWVRGHNGNVWNNYADRIAVLSRRYPLGNLNKSTIWDNITEEFNESLDGAIKHGPRGIVHIGEHVHLRSNQ